MLKRLLLPCLAMVAALAMGGATAEAKSLDDIIKAGVIRVGINPNFPPMSSRGSDGNWEGFDIDVGNKIAEALMDEYKRNLSNRPAALLLLESTPPRKPGGG